MCAWGIIDDSKMTLVTARRLSPLSQPHENGNKQAFFCSEITLKRYRVLNVDFDTRATMLSQEIQDSWEPKVRELWHHNQTQITEGLLCEFGIIGGKQKIKNFTDMGAAPWSIIGFHNRFMRQLRYAFVIGSYYPSLTAACALGERVLNQLMIHLRDDFKATPEYKNVYRKDSFDNWDIPIETLESWDVLLPNVVSGFRGLKGMRNQALHFNPETDTNDRELALAAIKKLTEIIEGQFAGGGKQPWFIEGTNSAPFIKKSHEGIPFVRRIVLPNCRLVGHLHTLERKHDGNWTVHDDHDYEALEISDDEFAELWNSR